MKIKSVYISKFRNIPEEKINFNTDLTSLIIGQNGLGKSNLLEAITLIFVAISNYDEYLNLSNFDGRYFTFELEYILKGKKIKITYGLNNKYEINIDNNLYILRDRTNDTDHFYPTTLTKIVNNLIPDFFITYYSGQNKRLQEILVKFEKVYIEGLKHNKDNNILTSRRKFMYLKNFHAPILMLVLSIFKYYQKDNGNIYHDKVENLFKLLGVKSIEKFSLTVKSPEWITKRYKENLTEDEKNSLGFIEFIHGIIDEEEKFEFPFWGLKSSLNKLLRCLFRPEIDIPNNNEFTIKSKKDFNEFIEFKDVSINELSQSIFEEFSTPLELFYAVEALVLLDCIDVDNDLKFVIKKDDSLSLTYNMLSEGENQLFIVLGIILITGSDETLFLLDEPDTYLNPKWQREYIHLLEDFNLEDDDSHILVTTHSPLLVQNIEGENHYNYDLILLSRNDDSIIDIDQDKSIFKNWRIDQVLASKYFDISSTRPKTLDDFMDKRSSILKKGKLDDQDIKELTELENEFGYLPTGETISELKSLAYINGIKNIV